MKRYNISGFDVIEVDETQSTNTLAATMGKTDLGDMSVLMTRKQTQGRGQKGNSWESEAYKNFSFTISLMPEQLPAGEQFAISMLIALACKDYIDSHLQGSPHVCKIKWPNDIYINDCKVAGILIEHEILGNYLSRSLCGIGLNVNQSIFVSDAPNPISLKQVLNKEFDFDEEFAGMLQFVAKRYESVYDFDLLKNEFEMSMFRRDDQLYEWIDGDRVFKAKIIGINEYGQLLLNDTLDNVLTYSFKEVKYVNSPNH